MKTRILGLLAVSLLVGPVEVGAGSVTWEIRGEIISVTNGSDGQFPSAAQGDPFEVLVTFDPSASLLGANTGGNFSPGTRYRYDPSSIRVSVSIGTEGPVLFSYDPLVNLSFLYVLDNTGYVSGGIPWDGITFGLGFDSLATEQVVVSMRGAILDIFNGPGLPTTPDARLAGLDQTFLTVGVNGAIYFGEITSAELATLSPEEQLTDLIELVIGLHVGAGIGNALDSKLQNAVDALDRAQNGDTASAVGILYAFINSVEAQRGKSLTDAQADELVAAAQDIIDALSQP